MYEVVTMDPYGVEQVHQAEDAGEAFRIASEQTGLSIEDARESGHWEGTSYLMFEGGYEPNEDNPDDTCFTIRQLFGGA